MKITIKNIIKENKDIDPKQKYINGILNMIRIPYFNFLKVNEVPEELWNDIFYRLFNHEVIISDNKIFDLNGPPRNLLYIEYYNGEWEKREYDSNNNNIYYEKSNGFWVKREYDENNNLLYSENSNGIIRDNRPSNSLNENSDPKERYINGIVNMIRIPYFNFLEVNEVPRKLWNRILSKLFKQKVTYSDIHHSIYDSNDNEIYREYSEQSWVKREYDSNRNNIYQEGSDGFWMKREFDENNNRIYYEDSNGKIIDDRPINPINENIDPKQKFLSLVVDNMIKQSKDNWFPFDSQKMSFTEYCKNVYGLTDDEIDYVYSKYRFLKGWDERDRSLPYLKKLIYSENTNGIIKDNRSSNSLNENTDPKQRYVNGILNMIRRPYFNFLEVNEVPEELWEDILSKIFNTKVTYSDNRIYDSNNNLIYRENSDGNWIKYEYDSNNNLIYRENSDGYWEKREYDSNNYIIYYEDSNGIIRDNRPINPINENKDIDPKQRYVNGILNMIRRPYMGFLINNEVPEELWKDILTKIFNTNDIDWGINPNPNPDPDFEVRYELIIQDEKGKQLYYETHDYWEQLIYGYHTRLDMDFTWYINSVGSKKVTFVGKHNPIVYSNGPTGHPWSGLSDDIKNNKFFDLNY